MASAAATASILEPKISSFLPNTKPLSLKWNPLFQKFPILSHHQKLLPIRSSKPFFRPPKPNPNIKCSSKKMEISSREQRNPFQAILDVVLKALKSLQKPAIAAVLVGVLMAYDTHSALAASGGRMGGRASSSSSYSSRSYSAPPSSRSGFSYSAPYYAPTPFGPGGGLYVGPAFGVGIGAGSGFFLLMMGFAAAILLSGFLSDRSDDGSVLTATQKTTVLKLQVGLLGMARTFQKDLDRIAETADTSTSEGLNYVLTETALALLRHPDCCISGYSSILRDLKFNSNGDQKYSNLCDNLK